MIHQKLKNKKALLLDMNNTFMFGEDRFNENEDYSIYYKKISGKLSDKDINEIIRQVLNYLGKRYPKKEYRNNFPSVENAIDAISNINISSMEMEKIVETFSYHEHGYIPEEYINTLFKLKRKFILSLVIDIWSPKKRWLETFKKVGINNLFSSISFSSDHGMVKPSPKPFELVVNQLNIAKENCLVVGDSIRRDLGGAKAAGIDCILVGGGKNNYALKSFTNLIEFCEEVT